MVFYIATLLPKKFNCYLTLYVRKILCQLCNIMYSFSYVIVLVDVLVVINLYIIYIYVATVSICVCLM